MTKKYNDTKSSKSFGRFTFLSEVGVAMKTIGMIGGVSWESSIEY
jgi:hypothetical protein